MFSTLSLRRKRSVISLFVLPTFSLSSSSLSSCCLVRMGPNRESSFLSSVTAALREALTSSVSSLMASACLVESLMSRLMAWST